MARRKGALFLPLDVNFQDDPLITAVGEQSGWLYLGMCLKAKSLLSDGVLTEPQIEKLAVKGWKQRLHRLLSVCDHDGKALVIDITGEGDPVRRYWISGWDNHNDRAETVLERREKDAARKRESRPDSVRIPFGRSVGVRSESVFQVEKSREEKSRRTAPLSVEVCDHDNPKQFCHECRATATA